MPTFSLLRESAFLLVAGVMVGPATWAVPVSVPTEGANASQSPSNLPSSAPLRPADNNSQLLPVDTGLTALTTLSQGRWTRACEMATGVLARNVPDVHALGLFGLCSASANDRRAADSALTRLREAEAPPYYALLVQGVLHLQDKVPEKAMGAFRAAQRARSNDPLALYLVGEAQHAIKRDAEAIVTFKAVLKSWPKFVPALTGAARLIAKPNAPQDQLKAARDMAEQATLIEPMNPGYWRLLADLCNRTGQLERANAITLQWLHPASVPK